MYRMQLGIKLIERIATRYNNLTKVFGLSGIGFGFAGMIAMSVMLMFAVVQAFTLPNQPASVTLVLPGMNLPGLGVLPFWYWLLAIFVIAVIHECSHGIVAYAHGLQVKYTGIVLLGPIVGAFVEPDEKKLTQANDVVQHSVYAAGAFSNIVLAVVVLLLMTWITVPLQGLFVTPSGFTFDSYLGNDLPFAHAGIPPGTVITGINGEKTKDVQQLGEELIRYHPGDKITVQTKDKTYSVTLGSYPEMPKRGYLGIKEIRNTYDTTYTSTSAHVVNSILEWFNGLQNNGRGFLFWLYLLSFGIGLFNLLPLPIVDGGRMLQTALKSAYGEEKGNSIFGKVSVACFILLLASLLLPPII